MPEGDSVFSQCRRLTDALGGLTLTQAEIRVPSLAAQDLVGWTVTAVAPRGKHLLIRLQASGREGLTLHHHLRMEGRWHVDTAAPGQELGHGRAPAHQARIVLEARREDGTLVRAIAYEVQQIRLLRTAAEAEVVGHLGPDLLDPQWDEAMAAQAVENLASAPERPIGLALLDQRNLAGIGNIYRSELCFLAGVHPALPTGQCPDLPGMVARARTLLWVNRDRPVRVTTGGMMGRDGDLWVYGRARRLCRRCRSPIRREEITDPAAPEQQERVIYVCPRCQASPDSTSANRGAQRWRAQRPR